MCIGVRLRANAKINLHLSVGSRREDGMHTVDTVMQSVDLCDLIDVCVKRGDGTELLCDDPNVPTDGTNLAAKAAEAYFAHVGERRAIRIAIEKHIPSRAGMGGGSADAAAVLVGLNRALGGICNGEELCAIGSRIGADVPFCISGGCKRMTGIGDSLAQTLASPRLHILVAKVGEGVSTPRAYAAIDRLREAGALGAPSSEPLLAHLLRGDAAGARACMQNDFEAVISDFSPRTARLTSFLSQRSDKAMLCGSGSAVFALFGAFEAAERCRREVANAFPDAFLSVCKTADEGVCVIKEY